MGIAYAAGMVLIYLLVAAQFRSHLVPLVIMAPIPLSVIGVMPGHALLGAQFTATSMIGMIALAGTIVRNSILLVDFINQSVTEGHTPEAAVIEACAVRTLEQEDDYAFRIRFDETELQPLLDDESAPLGQDRSSSSSAS